MNPVQRPLENVFKHPPIIMDLAVVHSMGAIRPGRSRRRIYRLCCFLPFSGSLPFVAFLSRYTILLGLGFAICDTVFPIDSLGLVKTMRLPESRAVIVVHQS